MMAASALLMVTAIAQFISAGPVKPQVVAGTLEGANTVPGDDKLHVHLAGDGEDYRLIPDFFHPQVPDLSRDASEKITLWVDFDLQGNVIAFRIRDIMYSTDIFDTPALQTPRDRTGGLVLAGIGLAFFLFAFTGMFGIGLVRPERSI